tara:strand:- start:1506 stop:2333 length:828 start_codon:yes stop_codon:yes gene_type:complete
MLSKHGTIYQASGHEWDWETPLKDAYVKGGQTAPTCATCHFEFRGQYGHNVVRKTRWGFSPIPEIANNLDDGWFGQRKEAWIATCSGCHSESFARAYQNMADDAVIAGLDLQQKAHSIVESLHADTLLVGQEAKRPNPPEPLSDDAGAFFQMFIAEGNNPTAVEMEHARDCRTDLNQLYKGVMHASPGGWAYTQGWGGLVDCYARVMDADTQLRQFADLKARLSVVEESASSSLLNLDEGVKKASVSGLGGALMLMGMAGLLLPRRRENQIVEDE